MAKKRRSTAEKVAKSAIKEQKANPFEFKYAKRKTNVASKNASATIVGAPGKSKRKAVDSRSSTLAKELEMTRKSGSIKDRRLGAMDSQASKSEKAAMRFALERRLVSSKKDIYKLGSTSEMNELTHLGDSVTSMENFGRMPTQDFDTENLDDEYLAKAHFGGGDLNENESGPGGETSSRKTLIDQLIAKSRLDKHTRQVQKDDVDKQRENIDEVWKELSTSGCLKGLVKEGKQSDKSDGTSDGIESYDAIMRQLQFGANEKRAGAGERTKSAAEIASEERKRLEKMESERLRRMNSDLADGKIDDKDTDDKLHLAYNKDGKLIDSGILAKSIKSAKVPKRVSFAMETNSEQEDVGSDQSDDDNVSEAGNSSDSDMEESGVIDETSKTAASSDIPFVLQMPKNFAALCLLLKSRRHSDVSVILERLQKLHHPSLEAGNKRKLSRLFTMLLRYFEKCAEKIGPSCMPILDALTVALYDLAQFDSAHAAKCVKALLKCHAQKWQKQHHRWPKFASFAILSVVCKLFPTSDRWHSVATPAILTGAAILGSAHLRDWRCIKKGLFLCSILLEYVHQSKRYVPEVLAFLMESIYAGSKSTETPGKCGTYAPIGNLPLDERLARCLMLNHAAPLHPIPPISLGEIFTRKSKSDQTISEQNQVDKIQATLLNALKIIRKCVELYDDIPYFSGVFSPLLELLRNLPAHLYVHRLRSEVVNMIERLSSLCAERAALLAPLKSSKGAKISAKFNVAPGGDTEGTVAGAMAPASNVPHIEMYEPRVESGFDPERKKHKTKGERAKLSAKLKREKRGAMRELRRDAEFLARRQHDSSQKLDSERKLKTKKLMHSLKNQEADFKAVQKEKNKLKKKFG